MTWEDLKTRQITHAANLTEGGKYRMLKGWEELEQLLCDTCPEVFDNPALLIRQKNVFPVSLFIEKINARTHGSLIYTAYKTMMNYLRHIEKNEDLLIISFTADQILFDSNMVSRCFAKWLYTKGWSVRCEIPEGYHQVQVSAAYKKGLLKLADSSKAITKIAVQSVGTVVDSISNNKPTLNKSGAKQRLGLSVINLLEVMAKNKNTLPCLVIADDKPTREVLKPFLTPIEKVGIKIFWVKSATEVEEN